MAYFINSQGYLFLIQSFKLISKMIDVHKNIYAAIFTCLSDFNSFI